jgi:hypothetical protein
VVHLDAALFHHFLELEPADRVRHLHPAAAAHGACVEAARFGRIETLFGLATTFTLYDLTNSHFEGTAAANPSAARGRSKHVAL